MHWRVDVLQRLGAAIGKQRVKILVNGGVRRARQADPAGIGEGFEAFPLFFRGSNILDGGRDLAGDQFVERAIFRIEPTGGVNAGDEDANGARFTTRGNGEDYRLGKRLLRQAGR